MIGNVRISDRIIVIATLVALVASFIWMKDVRLMVDEEIHDRQIGYFLKGEYRIDEALTQVPGYHMLIALAATATGMGQGPILRWLTMLFAVGCIVVFYGCARAVDRQHTVVRFLQCAMFPLLVPFYFLLYTDVASLCFVLLSFFLVLKQRPVLGGLASLVSILMRQNNIIWTLFLMFLVLADESWLQQYKDMKIHSLRSLAARLPTRSQFFSLLGRTSTFLFTFLLIAIFVVKNGGVAIGDESNHPFPSFHYGNIYMLLFSVFFLFIPLHAANGSVILQRVLTRPWYMLALAIFFLFYLKTFVNDHMYNHDAYFIRNNILMYFETTPARKILFFTPIFLVLLSLPVTRLLRQAYLWIYPLTALFLSLSWLVEPRYYLIPFSLFLLCRARASAWVEHSLILLFAICSAWFFYGTMQLKFFL